MVIKFPKNLYVLKENEDDPEDDCFTALSKLQDAISGEEDGRAIAVYELKKVGKVKNTTKIVFE